mgnify:CR=1 FL=1
MIHFERVSKRYDGAREALKGVTLDVADGELAFLTGRSGAGKSTVLKLIGLIEHATRGTVTVGGHNLAKLKNRAIPAHRQQIGMVFQDNKLLADRSAYENVALPLIITGVGARDIGRRVRAALDQVGLLDRERLPPRSLSAGEQQRVGIARAIVNRPKVVIADEPTGNLDPDLALEVMLLFKRLNAAGTTMLIATHDLHLVEHLGGRRIHLVDGQVGGTAGEATP